MDKFKFIVRESVEQEVVGELCRLGHVTRIRTLAKKIEGLEYYVYEFELGPGRWVKVSDEQYLYLDNQEEPQIFELQLSLDEKSLRKTIPVIGWVDVGDTDDLPEDELYRGGKEAFRERLLELRELRTDEAATKFALQELPPEADGRDFDE